MIKNLYMSTYWKGYEWFCKYLLSTYSISDTSLGAGDTTMEKWPQKSCIDGTYILGEETDSKWNNQCEYIRMSSCEEDGNKAWKGGMVLVREKYRWEEPAVSSWRRWHLRKDVEADLWQAE